MEPIVLALLLSTIAGLSTTIGSFIALFLKEPGPRTISFIMGFSAGVMILLSFVELLQQGIQTNGMFIGILFFLLGMGIMFLIDILISHHYEYEEKKGIDENKKKALKLEKTSLLVTLGVFIHNFPEGMATFIGTLKDFELGLLITLAIALHNIPEGIAVAATVSLHSDNKRKPFLWSFISGLSEPIGALVVAFILFPFINDYILSALLAVVAGFMVYISFDELLPMSRSLGKEHISIFGIIAGMFVIAISLALLTN